MVTSTIPIDGESALADYFRDPGSLVDSHIAWQLDTNAEVVDARRRSACVWVGRAEDQDCRCWGFRACDNAVSCKPCATPTS